MAASLKNNARGKHVSAVSENVTASSRFLIRLLADLDTAGILATLPRESRYQLRKYGNIALPRLIAAMTKQGYYLTPDPGLCVERLGGIRPAAGKTGLSVNTIQALKQGRATLRSYLILAIAHKSLVRLQKINPRAALWTAKDNTWMTPSSLLQQLYPLLPGKTFDIDPCSPCVGPAAPVRAHVHYTEKHDGLRQSWGKSTYCYVNPPFSHLRKWIHKALAEADNGVVSILLCPARVDSIWWHTLVANRIPVVMLRGRLHFGGGDNRQQKAPFASALLIIGGSAQLPKRVAEATGGWLASIAP